MSSASRKTDSPSSRRKRSKDFNISFVDGVVEGWAFDVPAAFRDALDIKFSSYVDKEASKSGQRVLREVWTRGTPPTLGFDKGHIFYEPAGCRSLVWSSALKKLTRTIQVRDAIPDQESGKQGFVKFELTYFRRGEAVSSIEARVSQAEFEELLKTGKCSQLQTGG